MNKVVVVLQNQCDLTEEIILSILNFPLFLWTFARSESYIKNGIEVHIKRGKAFELLYRPISSIPLT